MGRLVRLDAEMVRRGLVRSRTNAQEMIAQGKVKVSGEVVLKAARQVDKADPIVLTEDPADQYVSRGAYKLLGALEYLGKQAPAVQGRYCLDAGASTGGFTDVLLRHGAESVIAADVGYGQLAWKLQSDKRVIVMDRTNVRSLEPTDLPYRPTLLVGDLSFISLQLIIPALARCAAEEADFLLMVKPQFEIGKELLGAGGVVRNPDHHFSTVRAVALKAIESGLSIRAVAPSPLPGPAGNVEYFLYLEKTAASPDKFSLEELDGWIQQAVERGPAGKEWKHD
ncbi:TlyA family RNA methyltransferase [Actinomycetaceae bacterium TAE3-ERU4]|nr:TlyA family RNA methyltransferase [Actinomycetaceae bacterium TAE3-ERU4]